MRVRLKGIKKTTQQLADGSAVTYYYAWRGGPRLPGNPGEKAFVAAYNEAVAKERPASKENLSTVLDKFQDSQEFLKLAERTALDYKRHLKSIGEKFGKFPLSAMNDPRTRGKFLAWRDDLAKTSPRGADYVFSVFARALKIGIDRGLITVNPLKEHGRVWAGNRHDATWSDGDEAAMRAESGPALRLALTLAVWTGQRQGDLLKLTWSAYDEAILRVRQGKGSGKLVLIPVAATLKAELDAAPRSGLYIISHDGRPYTSDGFRSSWALAADRAKIAGLTFHDLRGTFATRCYECGATDAEVASITGHGADGQAHATLRRHYAHLSLVLAKECIRKLEARTMVVFERMKENG